jgi:glycine cleavage system H protein
MSEIPNELKYAPSHEWVREEDDGVVAIGITDHAQMLLGDLVFVELPEIGYVVERDGDCGVVESVKAASDVYAPVAGEVLAVNEALADAPETINQDPYGDGWIFKLKVADAAQLDDLLDADAYAVHAEAEAE